MKKTAKNKITIVECIVGVFAFNEQGKELDAAIFPKRIDQIAEALLSLQRGEPIDAVIQLVKQLVSKGFEAFIFESDRLAQNVKKELDVMVSVEKLSKAGEYLRSHLSELAVTSGFVTSPEEFYSLVHDVSTTMTKLGVKAASGKRDLLVSQAIIIIDDLDKTFNLFANRLREWYGYYFPELSGLVDKSDAYVRLVAALGERANFTVENIKKVGLTAQQAESISAVAENSMGAELGEKGVTEIRNFSNALLQLYSLRDNMEAYLNDLMGEVAPNIRELVGSTMGAHLIAATGSLENLSKKSSGTIQVLGAEKALFRALKTGTRPPKHGMIFQFKTVHQSPRWQRGKISRALAGKLAIAARLDAYGGAYRGDQLKAEFEKRVDEIKTRYAAPPKKGRDRR